jgi:hypothetical protein
MIPALEALERLREGNARFVADIRSHATVVEFFDGIPVQELR